MRWPLLAVVLVGCSPSGGADASADAAMTYDVAPSGTRDLALVGRWTNPDYAWTFQVNGYGLVEHFVAECRQTASQSFVWSTDGTALVLAAASTCDLVVGLPSCEPDSFPSCNRVGQVRTWSISGDELTLTLDTGSNNRLQRAP